MAVFFHALMSRNSYVHRRVKMRQYQSRNPLGIHTLQPYSILISLSKHQLANAVATPIPRDALGSVLKFYRDPSRPDTVVRQFS